MRFCFLVIIYVSGFISCSDEKKSGQWQITEDSVAIDQTLFNAKHRIKDISGENYFQSYDKDKNEIVLIELDSSKTILRFKPKINFADTVAGRLVQFDIYKADSIFVVTENNIFIVNALGEIIYNKDLSTPMKDSAGVEIVFWDNDNQFPLYYDYERKELLLRTSCNCSFMSPEYFHRKIEAKLNLINGEINLFNYIFPDKYKRNFYGQAVFPFREVNGSLSIVSFQSDDSLYVFNRSTDSLAKYDCKSRYQEINFIPFDTAYNDDLERVKEHLIVSPMYQKILFDKFRNLYYRFFLKEQPLKDSKGVYHGLFDRDIIIMVLDSNFKVIDEKNIGNSYLWYYSFVSEKGLHVRKYVKKKPDTINNKYEYFTVFSWN